jgi:hypothetical protein
VPADPSWLDRLDCATDYRALQEIFSEIAASAESAGDDPAGLGRSIDEAVRRLEEERASDERELAEIQSRFDAFREQNKGVAGWFRRHIPFTETRREESELKGGVAEHSAEILADNLVIARAQMLKERFLGPEQRRLGERPGQWRERLSQLTAGGDLAPRGKALQDLAGEVERSRAFVDALRHDIDAFATAPFQAAEDRKQRDADVSAARQELAGLIGEIEAEAELEKTGLKQLGKLVATELETRDAAFQTDGRQLARLRDVLGRTDAARTSLGQLLAAAAAVGKLVEELKAQPARLQEARQALTHLQNQRTEASGDAANKAAYFEEQRRRHEAARSEAQQTAQVLAGAQQLYDAWQAEYRANPANPPLAEAPTDSPMWQRLNEAKMAAEGARVRLNQTSAPFEKAKKDSDAARADVEELTKKVDHQRSQTEALERRAPQLKLELVSAGERTHGAFAAAATALATYLAGERATSADQYGVQSLSAGMSGWLGARGVERSMAEALVQAEYDYQRHLQGVQVLHRLSQWLDAQRQSTEQERSAAHARRDTLWKRRCRELLGEPLSSKACASGLRE